MKRHYISALILLVAPFALLSQTISVKGRVTDITNNEPIPGVTVLIKGTTQGTLTDVDGNYTINADANGTLAFSFVGYKSKEIPINNMTSINVELDVDVTQLDEVVVLGYTTQKKKDLTGAVAVVNLDEVGEVPYANVLQGLQGRVAGVNITQDGQPGSGSTRIRIRGLTTFNNNNPLYVIDGIPSEGTIENLNPNDIESIQVLKDASAASIYGSRSANGVVVITTKKGRGGKLNIDAGVVLGLQTVPKTVEVLNGQEWGDMYWQASAYSGQTPNIDIYGGRVPVPVVQENIPFQTPPNEAYPNGQTYVFTSEGTNWADEVYRNAKNNQYYVNISTGSDKASAMFGLSYFDQDGTIDHTYFDRITARINSDFKLFDGIRIGENLSVAYTDQNQIDIQSTNSGIPYQVIRQHPILPIYDLDGNFAGGNVLVGGLAFPNAINPVAELDRRKNNNSDSWRVFGNAYLDIGIFDALKHDFGPHRLNLKTNYGVDYSNFFTDNFFPQFVEGGSGRPQSELFNEFGEGTTTTWINTIEYGYETDLHNFQVIGGYEFVKYRFRNIAATAFDFQIDDEDFVTLRTGEGDPRIDAAPEEWALQSFFARADYAYQDKYLVSATVRYDETSRFDDAGIFPAFSLGWNIDREGFAENIFNNQWLSQLKIRGSWGVQGNQFATTYPSFSTFGPGNPATDDQGADYSLDGNNTTVDAGLITFQAGNPDLKWETTTQTNIGFDLFLFDNSFQVNFDYYHRNTDDIIVPGNRIAAEGEGANPDINAASMINKGVDLNMTYIHEKQGRDFSFNTSLQFSSFNNEVDALGSDALIDPVTGENYRVLSSISRATVGRTYGEYYGWIADGIFRDQDEVDAHANQPEKAPGRIRYKDISGPDGIPDGVVDDFDRTYLGSAIPDFSIGWNFEAIWKDLSLSMFWYASVGNDVYNFTRQNTDFFEPNFNVGRRILDSWTPENPNASIPAAQTVATNNERRPSSYFVEDASFLRLRSLRLSYNIPTSFVETVQINLYGEIQNVFTVTGYTGLDPEVPFAGDENLPGVDQGIYPIPRIYMFGISLKL